MAHLAERDGDFDFIAALPNTSCHELRVGVAALGSPRMSGHCLNGIFLRMLRLGLLAAAVWLIREQHQRAVAAQRAPLSAERIRDFFPDAASVEPDAVGLSAVKNADGGLLGFVAETAPGSDRIIGYSGPTNTLLVFDGEKKISGLRILGSGDTPDHLAEVIRERSFFAQFRGLKLGERINRVDAVSGATLTSAAIAESVLKRLSGAPETKSLRFPEEISIAEVRELEPKAESLRPVTQNARELEVLDGADVRIGIVTRTAPVSDGIVGYQGPSDTLMLFDPAGTTLRGIRIRKSYDTKAYVAYVTGDAYFMNLFNGKSARQLAVLDFEKEKIEGVSGATETSWAIAEALKKRSQDILAERKERRPWFAQIRWRWQDAGHVVIILSAFLMAFTGLRGNALARNVHHLALVVYGGFIAGEILSQALFVGWARHGVPWRSAFGLVLLGVVALLAPALTRRQMYCHHICPHGAFQQLLMRGSKWQWSPSRKLSVILEKIPVVLLALAFSTGIAGMSFDLNNIEPFDAYLVSIASWAAMAIAVVGLVWSVFTPMAYCRYGCPTGTLFKLLRFTGDADRMGKADWISLAVVAAAAVFVYAR